MPLDIFFLCALLALDFNSINSIHNLAVSCVICVLTLSLDGVCLTEQVFFFFYLLIIS